MTYFDMLQKSFRCWPRRTARHDNPSYDVLHSQPMLPGSDAGGMEAGALRILPPWLQKQAGFPGDDVACVGGNPR